MFTTTKPSRAGVVPEDLPFDNVDRFRAKPIFSTYGEKVPGLIQSVERSAELLRLIGDYPATLGLSEIAATLDLAKPTAYGLLQTLKSVGFVEQIDPGGKYVLTPSLLNIGNERLDPNELRSHCLNWADSLASHCGEAVHVAMWQDGQATLAHHVFRPDDSAQTLQVGLVVPAHASALGKTLLAWSPAPARLAGPHLDRFTQHTVTSSRLLVRSLVAVREQGWAGEVEELSLGHASIAAPIRRSGGRVVAAMGVSGPVERLCGASGQFREQTIKQVTEFAAAVSRDLAIARR